MVVTVIIGANADARFDIYINANIDIIKQDVSDGGEYKASTISEQRQKRNNTATYFESTQRIIFPKFCLIIAYLLRTIVQPPPHNYRHAPMTINSVKAKEALDEIASHDIKSISDGGSIAPTNPRCGWVNLKNPLYLRYHDEEWGVPCHDETRLFEMLNLEGAQAGLSWETVLNKRENYRVAFDCWDAKKIARYDADKVAELMANAGIIRNRLKIAATINNAKAYLQLCKEVGGLDAFLWAYVEGRPLQGNWFNGNPSPAKTPLSDQISKDLLKRGFKFVGSTIIYAYLQGVGLIDDHTTECFRHHAAGK